MGGDGALSDPGLTYDAFRIGAAAMFLAAGALRAQRWHRTLDVDNALMAAAFVVLGALSLPLGTSPGDVVHTAGTLVCLGLVHRALRATDRVGRADRRFVLGLTGLLATGVAVTAAATALAQAPRDRVLGLVAVQLALAAGWLWTGLAASRRDTTQPWAGRVSPLFGSLGIVEVLQAAEHLQPGTWGMPAVALLGSVAMVTLHCAFVDLTAAPRSAADPHREDELHDRVVPVTEAWRTSPTAFDVSDVVAAAVAHRAAGGRDIRLRGGGGGTAHGRPADLAAVLDELLANAIGHAPHSPVTVHVVAIADRIEVSVADRGPGLSAEKADRVLGAGPADVRPSSRVPGLQAARALMERSGGRLELRTRIGGTTFVAVLPASRAAAPAGAHRDGWHAALQA